MPHADGPSAAAIFEKPAKAAIGHTAVMQINLTSILVDDQAKALRCYTEVLGFKTSKDFPVGEYRWITVVSPEGPAGVELALEPNANPAAKTFQDAMFKQGIPLAAFEVRDLPAEFAQLSA